MSAASPYYLIAQRQLDRIAAELPASVGELCSRWWARSIGIAATVSRCGDADVPASAIGCLLRGGEHWLLIAADECDWQTLAGAWLDVDVGADSALAQALQRAFCAELFAALAGAPPVETAAPAALRPREWPALLAPGSGGLCCRIRLDDIPLTLLASPSLWPAPNVSAARSAPPLTPCHAALGETRVRLQVGLPPVHVPLTDLAALAPGDFLRLGLDLSGSVWLRGENIELALTGSIGRNGDRKAVKLDVDVAAIANPSSSTRAGQPHERQ